MQNRQRLDSKCQNTPEWLCEERGCAGPESPLKWRDTARRRKKGRERERERRLPVVHLHARQYAFEPVAHRAGQVGVNAQRL